MGKCRQRFIVSLMIVVAMGTGVLLLGGSGRNASPNKVFAIVTPPTNTPGPTPTPLPGDLYDLWEIEAGPGQFHCIARTDQDPVTLGLSATAQCYSETDTGFAGAEPPCDAVYSATATPTPVVPGEGNCDGHVSPPPYTTHAPVKLAGSYDPLSYTVSYKGCFADVGGAAGPNIVVEFTGLGATMTANIWFNQANANCDANPPTHTGGSFSYPVTMTGVNPQRDYDGDGCKDAQELWAGKPGGSTTCGDDPWNPYDSPSGATPDVSGSWDIVMEAARADYDSVNHMVIPGFYYECKSDIQQATPTPTLTANTLCYVDSPVVTVNPQAAAGVNNCPPFGTANAKYCGAGLPGAAPPGCSLSASCIVLPPYCPGAGASGPCDVSQYQFAHVGSQHTALSGTLDNSTHTIGLSGCFQDLTQLGNVYLQAKINAYTGIGIGNLYPNQAAQCVGSPTGTPTFVRIAAVRQAPGGKAAGDRDSDGDGCSDKRELSNDQTQGGLRDPLNRFDYPDMPTGVNGTKDHKIRIEDVTYVINRYRHDQGGTIAPLYDARADHTIIAGSSVWNLGPPDGQIRIQDVTTVQGSYRQDCA